MHTHKPYAHKCQKDTSVCFEMSIVICSIFRTCFAHRNLHFMVLLQCSFDGEREKEYAHFPYILFIIIGVIGKAVVMVVVDEGVTSPEKSIDLGPLVDSSV